MTVPVSITKAAKAQLFASLTAQLVAADDAELLVCYDGPGPKQPGDIVSVGAVRRVVTAAALVGSLGANSLQDTVAIDVTVSVYREGDEAQATFERGCDLVDDVVAVVRADPTLAGIVLKAAPTQASYGEAEWTEDHKGRVSESVVTITCTSLI